MFRIENILGEYLYTKSSYVTTTPLYTIEVYTLIPI